MADMIKGRIFRIFVQTEGENRSIGKAGLRKNRKCAEML